MSSPSISNSTYSIFVFCSWPCAINLSLAIAARGVCLVCVSRRRQNGKFDADCVNVDVDVDVDVKRSVGEVGKWHLPYLSF